MKNTQSVMADLTGWVDKQVILQTLHISERTLQNWRKKGLIVWSRIGGKFFYWLPSVVEILQKNRH